MGCASAPAKLQKPAGPVKRLLSAELCNPLYSRRLAESKRPWLRRFEHWLRSTALRPRGYPAAAATDGTKQEISSARDCVCPTLNSPLMPTISGAIFVGYLTKRV